MGEPILPLRIDFTTLSGHFFFRIWNEYGNITAAEFDVNRRSSI